MLSAVADLSGSFPKTCFKQLFCRELPVPASVKRNSTPGAILEIFQNFTNMQRLQTVIWRLEIYYKETPLQRFS